MKKLFATFCIIGTTFALSACETGTTASYDSGANFATERTAGDMDPAPMQAAQPERVFQAAQTK